MAAYILDPLDDIITSEIPPEAVVGDGPSNTACQDWPPSLERMILLCTAAYTFPFKGCTAILCTRSKALSSWLSLLLLTVKDSLLQLTPLLVLLNIPKPKVPLETSCELIG